MIRKLSLTAAAILALAAPGAALAAGGAHVTDFDFSFEGPFGSFDQNQLQRGLQVYTEVCSACHGLEQVPFRTLSDEGGPMLPDEQMRAYAAEYQVFDPALNDGEGGRREAKPQDQFPPVTAANAPDLSLMAKARAGFHGPYGTGISQLVNGMGGPEYIASILTGYEEAPECAPEDFTGNYNVAFEPGGYPDSCLNEEGERTVPGSWIGMPPPLMDEGVAYQDDTAPTVEQQAKDVAAFLMWTAEPKMMARKTAGLTGVIFLTVLAVLLYLTNKRLWAPHKGKKTKV